MEPDPSSGVPARVRKGKQKDTISQKSQEAGSRRKNHRILGDSSGDSWSEGDDEMVSPHDGDAFHLHTSLHYS